MPLKYVTDNHPFTAVEMPGKLFAFATGEQLQTGGHGFGAALGTELFSHLVVTKTL